MDELTDKQSKILAYIGDFMQKKGYPPTVREIGSRFSIASSSVFDHLKALEGKGVLKRSPGKSRSFELLNKETPAARSGKRLQIADIEPLSESVETIEIPLLGRVAAGMPMLAAENIEEMVTLPRHWVKSGKIFALRIHGDSMIGDGIYDTDVAIVRMQPNADNGDIVVALIEDEATVKRFYRQGKSICLRPSNPKYEDIVVDRVNVLGKVIGLFRKFK